MNSVCFSKVIKIPKHPTKTPKEKKRKKKTGTLMDNLVRFFK